MFVYIYLHRSGLENIVRSCLSFNCIARDNSVKLVFMTFFRKFLNVLISSSRVDECDCSDVFAATNHPMCIISTTCITK